MGTIDGDMMRERVDLSNHLRRQYACVGNVKVIGWYPMKGGIVIPALNLFVL